MIWARIEERDVGYKKYNCNGELLVITFDVVLGGNEILFSQLQILIFSFRHIMALLQNLTICEGDRS